jgi:uncharacterized protein YvpB
VIRLFSSIAVVLALQPFFEFFRGTPHQLAAIKELEDSMPPELLQEDASWFEAWKQSGITQRLAVPYFHQLDHGPRGYRMCFTTSAAMVAAFYGFVNTQQEYSKVRDEFGDTIYVSSHLKALRKLGLEAEFRNNADDALLEAEIASGRPVLVGWLHRGDIRRREPPSCDERGCGHWSVIVGFDQEFWYMHDPMGQVDMELGGHFTKYGGKNVKIPRASFRQRWQIEGKNSGWVVTVKDV